MANLSPFHVKNAKPGRHGDGKGLYLLVGPGGSKSWVLRVQANGRRRDFGLGSLDVVSLSEAREKAAEGRKMVREGLDPAIEWRRRRTPAPTFEGAARLYHGTVKGSWRNPKHADQWINTLETYAFPNLGKLTVNRIDAADIQSVLIPIWQSIPETARRVRQRIGTVLDYARGQGWRDSEAPMRAVNTLMKGIRQPKAKNFSAMPYEAVPSFVAKLQDGGISVGKLALRFLILTAARSGEVRGATWPEIDLQQALWNIPADRMKAREAHSVPLTKEAVEVLEAVKPFSGGKANAFVFPGLKRGQPLSDMTLTKVLKTSGANGYTVHGFRSSFRDWVADCTSYPGEWAEAALSHTLPNKVEAAYRRTKFLGQRRPLMESWAAYLIPRTSDKDGS
jgi:integrase